MEHDQLMLNIVTNAIRKWDPYGLIKSGAPLNEFDGEIARVAQGLSLSSTKNEIAQVLSDVFCHAFNTAQFTVTSCLSVADDIHQHLSSS